ncbi:MAG: stage V sporulation protein AC [Clostridia bacterium]|nr:stage V sporulation protein AC [Clostridia bacterium]
MDKEEYKELVKRRERRSPSPKNCLRAFWTGGLICVIGQLLTELFLTLGMSEKSASTTTTVALIFAAALLTGIGIFDRIARYAGAGTLVPVTGFANSVVSPAIDTKSEGLILGVGAKIFTVAGPVLLYATLSGAVYGVIYYIVSLFL